VTRSKTSDVNLTPPLQKLNYTAFHDCYNKFTDSQKNSDFEHYILLVFAEKAFHRVHYQHHPIIH